MNLISKHLDKKNLKLKVYQVDSICAFTGKKITEGVLMKDLIKKTFTDQELKSGILHGNRHIGCRKTSHNAWCEGKESKVYEARTLIALCVGQMPGRQCKNNLWLTAML